MAAEAKVAAKIDYGRLFRVAPGKPVRLDEHDADATPGFESKEEAEATLAPWGERLAHQQRLLYAGKRHALLIVLQGMDAAGKDGAIRRAFAAFNPQGVIVNAFKEPSTLERAHDFLWRIHMHAPELGAAAIFNRSHYEDFLVNRARGTLADVEAALRLKQIRHFEALLAQNGVVILKFFLHISKEEQLARFRKRLRDPEANWKIAESDYTERLLWNDYMAAYEEALSGTSEDAAPWHVVPANRKWFRDVVLLRAVVAALEALDMRFPPPSVDLALIEQKYHSAAREQAKMAAAAQRPDPVSGGGA